MPQYMLLLYDDPAGWRNLSPEEMQKATEKYPCEPPMSSIDRAPFGIGVRQTTSRA